MGHREVPPAVGIDVGGPTKGFHAVALPETGPPLPFASRDPTEVARWCRTLGAHTVGIDAPAGWSATGGARPAERALMAAGFHCFASPTRAAALAHPRDYFGWMLNGERLYAALAADYPLYTGRTGRRPTCFETFPQAIACGLAGRTLPAREKATVRRALLAGMGIDVRPLRRIDLVDAALCAVAARAFRQGRFVQFGDPATGFIVLPAPLTPGGARQTEAPGPAVRRRTL